MTDVYTFTNTGYTISVPVNSSGAASNIANITFTLPNPVIIKPVVDEHQEKLDAYDRAMKGIG